MDLNTIIPHYYELKHDYDNMKKAVESENADIKFEMERRGIKNYTAGGVTAKYIVAKKETFDEEKLIELFHSKGLDDFIKTKEYVDLDLVEDALYHNNISVDTILEMEKCKIVKETVQLRVSKKKEAKTDE